MVRFDNEQFRMEPGQTKISKLDLPAGGDFTPFTIEDIEGKKLAGTQLFSHARGREMVLIFSGRIRGRQKAPQHPIFLGLKRG